MKKKIFIVLLVSIIFLSWWIVFLHNEKLYSWKGVIEENIPKEETQWKKLLPFKNKDYLDSFKEEAFLKKTESEYSCKNINEIYIAAYLEILPQYCREFIEWDTKILQFLVLRKSYAGIDFLVLEKFTINADWYFREDLYINEYPEFITNAKNFWVENFALWSLDRRDYDIISFFQDSINTRLKEDYKNQADWIKQLFIKEK